MPPRRAQADVALYGATGYTGRLAAHAMAAAGLDVILAGRNQEALEALAQEVDAAGVRVAASDDPEALLRVAESAAVLVSCAGPFAEVGELVVAAAIAAGRHYLDSTGETTFMAQTHRRHDARARAAGVVVMNSCAFEYVLGDCAAELALIDLPEARELDVAYHVDHPRLSQGTALSALGIMASGKVPVRSRRFTFSDGAQAWAASYPGGETELVPRRHPGVAVTAWLSLPPAVARLAPAASGLAPLLGSGPVRGPLPPRRRPDAHRAHRRRARPAALRDRRRGPWRGEDRGRQRPRRRSLWADRGDPGPHRRPAGPGRAGRGRRAGALGGVRARGHPGRAGRPRSGGRPALSPAVGPSRPPGRSPS